MPKDLTIPVTTDNETERISINEYVETIIQAAICEGNGWIAIQKAKEIKEFMRVSGLGLAKLIYEIYSHWHELNIMDDFWLVITAHVGLGKGAITRYIQIGEFLDYIKEDNIQLAEELENKKSTNDLVTIARTYLQEYEISEEDYQKFLDAPNNASVMEVARQIKGQEPKPSTLRVVLDDESGEITAYIGESANYVGTLAIHSASPSVQTAIRRIITGGNIIVSV